ncbi:MAG: F0F1 ATP synthase subunit epsilon [Zoogloeaceae bacterium]|jgi:F-type H+-transporting ATPase subunit epsilon|nr:F0F1 ATP synthase subunit epsilon [Zoogloeaceae bacterium]
MAMTIRVDIVSAEEELFSGLVEFAVFPGESGELGVMPRHTPLLTRVKAGTVRLKMPDENRFEMIYVSGGMLEVQPHLITVLADTAIRAADLDEAKALEAKRHAEETLAKRAGNLDLAAAEAELVQSIGQLQAIKKLKDTAARH